MKDWNKGRFGFWFYTKSEIRARDAVMTRIMEAQGSRRERERIIKLLDVLATQEPDYAQVLIHNLKVLIKGENN